MLLAAAPDAKLQGLGKRVHDGHADTVQPARDLVGVLVEFPAGMELGHDDLGGRHALLLVDLGRNAAAVINDRYGPVRIEGDGNGVAIAGQGLVDRVVEHLVDHVMEARAVLGIADIHARPLAHGVQSAQHLDRFGAVAFGAFLGTASFAFVCHDFFRFLIRQIAAALVTRPSLTS